MSLLALGKVAHRGPKPTYPGPGEFRDGKLLSETMPSLNSTVQKADMIQSKVTALPLTFVGVAYLYDKAVISGNSNRSWSLGDFALVVIASWMIVNQGVRSRWGGS